MLFISFFFCQSKKDIGTVLRHRQGTLVLCWYVYTLRLIGPISYPGECDLMVQLQKYSEIFSRMHFVTFVCI